jgi:hypothetical protein
MRASDRKTSSLKKMIDFKLGKQGGKRRNKHQPVVSGETGLLDSKVEKIK